ncbi:uncharacterized protein LOC119299387 [Triticum dicoccoides]|uniref:uncharacterized protein LOC119299387 n=1 Tax=Triticum dicoccoides TaxID=85692 RepID=UPI001890AA63|nr:uncharacterized protein LOC119299387 [Triticum dicoccoides]
MKHSSDHQNIDNVVREHHQCYDGASSGHRNIADAAIAEPSEHHRHCDGASSGRENIIDAAMKHSSDHRNVDDAAREQVRWLFYYEVTGDVALRTAAAQPSAFSLSPLHPLLHCSCPAAPSSARRLTSAARSAREARPHELREGGGQYGEAPCPHERREVKVQRRPIRGGAATARAPRGPGAEAANTASGACPATIRPPRRARPCSYASYPGWTSPRALSPPASPSSPTASAIPVASEDFQINTEAPCRSQRLAKYNTTTRQVALLVCGAEAMPAPFFAKTFLQMI